MHNTESINNIDYSSINLLIDFDVVIKRKVDLTTPNSIRRLKRVQAEREAVLSFKKINPENLSSRFDR